MKRSSAAFFLASALAMAAAVANAQPAAPAQLPAGPGRDLINERCVSCHSVSMITAQRKDATGWAVTVQQMASRGAEVSPEEMSVMVEYLAAALPPRSNAPRAGTTSGGQGG